jgi:deoxyadenosine/deoxycytidine kinase
LDATEQYFSRTRTEVSDKAFASEKKIFLDLHHPTKNNEREVKESEKKSPSFGILWTMIACISQRNEKHTHLHRTHLGRAKEPY